MLHYLKGGKMHQKVVEGTGLTVYVHGQSPDGPAYLLVGNEPEYSPLAKFALYLEAESAHRFRRIGGTLPAGIVEFTSPCGKYVFNLLSFKGHDLLRAWHVECGQVLWLFDGAASEAGVPHHRLHFRDVDDGKFIEMLHDRPSQDY